MIGPLPQRFFVLQEVKMTTNIHYARLCRGSTPPSIAESRLPEIRTDLHPSWIGSLVPAVPQPAVVEYRAVTESQSRVGRRHHRAELGDDCPVASLQQRHRLAGRQHAVDDEVAAEIPLRGVFRDEARNGSLPVADRRPARYSSMARTRAGPTPAFENAIENPAPLSLA